MNHPRDFDAETLSHGLGTSTLSSSNELASASAASATGTSTSSSSGFCPVCAAQGTLPKLGLLPPVPLYL